MSNSYFCVGQPKTKVNFNPTQIIGKPSGYREAQYTTSKSGGCNDWLRFESILGS